MSRAAHDRFERVIAERYESLKPEVLATVRGKLAGNSLHLDASELDAAYNAAWHALYEQSRRESGEVSNLGGWLATITYRRAIDEVRSARARYRAPVAVGESISDLGYEPDVVAEIADRQRYHQWLVSVRLRLSVREQRAVSLCVLHEHSRRVASEMMGIDIKRLDKIMIAANKKMGGLLEAINRGDWCQEQRSLIKAFALGLHEEGGERHELAIAHVMECQACAAYVRSLRGLAVILPAPALLASAAATGGGIIGGAAAGGGGASVLGSIGTKTAALCVSAVCAAGGAVIVVERTPDANRPADALSASSPTPRVVPATTAVPKGSSAKSSGSTRPATISKNREPPDPKSRGAQEIAELGIEPQATAAPPAKQVIADSVPRAASASEFGIGP